MRKPKAEKNTRQEDEWGNDARLSYFLTVFAINLFSLQGVCTLQFAYYY